MSLPETGPLRRLGQLRHLMRSFVRDNQIPGAALAVARQGQLVYARGFGYADVEHQEPVRPDSLFRIASISKPITAAAILQLVDAGKLHLEDRVLDILPQTSGPADSNEHRPAITRCDSATGAAASRWLGPRGIDGPDVPLDRDCHQSRRPTPATLRDIIRFMMGQRLDFDPGCAIRLFQLRLLRARSRDRAGVGHRL